MALIDNLDWLTLCPEKFRQRCKTYLEMPKASDINWSSRQNRVEAEVWGKFAEAITARYLLLKGLPIREWNWKPGRGKGEIDLISQKGERILFIEVKARNGKSSDPWESITPAKIKDLCHGADMYLKMLNERFDYQFDIALLTGKYDNYDFEYIEDAFLCPLKTVKNTKY